MTPISHTAWRTAYASQPNTGYLLVNTLLRSFLFLPSRLDGYSYTPTCRPNDLSACRLPPVAPCRIHVSESPPHRPADLST
ncbi:hypothetical protein CGCF413_v014764 [Colletotrichum fructicola]|nr:hypothetical protein CGCF413_v014764 [Colletotrichum fructicola]